ncbi:hypothetical protein J3F84DRAFT_348968 [Trichoderma pleuroticola]
MLYKSLLSLSCLVFSVAAEQVFLSNCQYTSDGQLHSAFFYYADGDPSGTEFPTADNQACVEGFGCSDVVTWEGTVRSGNFPSGERFTSNINAGAQNLATGQYAGQGQNRERYFNCYKDNNRQLFGGNALTQGPLLRISHAVKSRISRG